MNPVSRLRARFLFFNHEKHECHEKHRFFLFERRSGAVFYLNRSVQVTKPASFYLYRKFGQKADPEPLTEFFLPKSLSQTEGFWEGKMLLTDVGCGYGSTPAVLR